MGLAAAGLAGAVAIGIVGAVIVSAWLIPLVVVGAFLALAYNLELFGGRFHTDLWFAVALGLLPRVHWLVRGGAERPARGDPGSDRVLP